MSYHGTSVSCKAPGTAHGFVGLRCRETVPRAPTEPMRLLHDAPNTFACEVKSSERVCCFVQTGRCRFHRGATCCCAFGALALHATAHVKVQPYLGSHASRLHFSAAERRACCMHPICHSGAGTLVSTATQGLRRAILESVALRSFILLPVLGPLG
jgi:hypothetical protein